MDNLGFRAYLLTRQLSEERIDQYCQAVEHFGRYLQDRSYACTVSTVDPETIQQYVDHLLQDGLQHKENLLALARYFWYIRNTAAYVAILQFMDDVEAVHNLE